MTCKSLRLSGASRTVANRCGVHFDEPIGTTEFVALRKIAVDAEQSGITPEELQASADWMNGLAR